MKDLDIDIRPAGEPWTEQYGPDTMSVKIREAGHFGSVLLSRDNALIIAAARDLYAAVKAEFDFITGSEESVKMAMYALDKAEGVPIGTRWARYLQRATR